MPKRAFRKGNSETIYSVRITSNQPNWSNKTNNSNIPNYPSYLSYPSYPSYLRNPTEQKKSA